jgi:cation diffusion facilitator family transporter
MGMASFEVVKNSVIQLLYPTTTDPPSIAALASMASIVLVKIALLWLCKKAARDKHDPTLEALALDHWNDSLSNIVACIALAAAYYSTLLNWLDPIGAIFISFYIIYSWYITGKEQIEHLIGRAAPEDFLTQVHEIASSFDERMQVDSIKAYHFGPKFLVELEMIMPETTLLLESHDLGMDLQYEIEALEEVERCFVHIDYERRDYDEHVVSKVPELREKYQNKGRAGSVKSLCDGDDESKSAM